MPCASIFSPSVFSAYVSAFRTILLIAPIIGDKVSYCSMKNIGKVECYIWLALSSFKEGGEWSYLLGDSSFCPLIMIVVVTGAPVGFTLQAFFFKFSFPVLMFDSLYILYGHSLEFSDFLISWNIKFSHICCLSEAKLRKKGKKRGIKRGFGS